MPKGVKSQKNSVPDSPAITEIWVAGFKSIADEQRIDIKPLTILAGANSSGKSSMMQPLLLLKQTLEAAYDPGPLLLNGPNVKFASADQLLSRIGHQHPSAGFHVGMRLDTGAWFQTNFRQVNTAQLQIEQMKVAAKSGELVVWPGMTPEEIEQTGLTRNLKPPSLKDFPNGLKHHKHGRWGIGQTRCFLQLEWVLREGGGSKTTLGMRRNIDDIWKELIPLVIHLPGWRVNPELTWPVTAVGSAYPGTFEKYAASVVLQWTTEDQAKLAELNADLRLLRVASGIVAKRLYDIQVELYVARLPDAAPNRPENQVSIAQVGTGVSQFLPVLVALHAAKPNQLVYVDQPETHLHPRAQFVLAKVLAAAVKARRSGHCGNA